MGRGYGVKGTLAVDFGVAMYAISYNLVQTNNILRTQRTQHEHWLESGPTFGIRYRSHDIELSYAFRANCGNNGCQFIAGGDKVEIVQPAVSAGGIIAAPSSPLFFRGVSETSHHLTVSMPIR